MMEQRRPRRLFKYLGEGGKSIFENGRILFRRPEYLNDLFDFAPRFLPLDDLALEREAKEFAQRNHAFDSAFGKKVPPWREYWQKNRVSLIQQMRHEWNKIRPHAGLQIQKQFIKTSVLCLTESESDLLMWAHYASGHKGFLIEFNLLDPFFADSKINEVRYQAERPVLGLNDEDSQNMDFVLRKGMPWKYETEWRIFKNWQKAAKPFEENGTVTGGLFDLPGTAIERVVIGFRATPVFVEHLTFLLKKSDYRHVAVERAQPNADEFKLDYLSI